jgi:hypothetical protein
LGGIIYIHIKQWRGQGGTCGTLACIILGADISPSIETENFPLETKELMNLIMLAEKPIFDNLYSKPAISISKNTAAIDILLNNLLK